MEWCSLLTVAFTIGENDTSVTLYDNTKYNDDYKNSIRVFGEGASGMMEKLKMTNPMQWVSLIDACKAQAEEVVLT